MLIKAGIKISKKFQKEKQYEDIFVQFTLHLLILHL